MHGRTHAALMKCRFAGTVACPGFVNEANSFKSARGCSSMTAMLLFILLYIAPANEAVALHSGSLRTAEQRSHSESLLEIQAEALLDTKRRSHLHLMSKAQVMATMTMERAMSTLQAMRHKGFDPTMLTMVQHQLGLTAVGASNSSGGQALETTRDMLNDMMYQVVMKQELDELKCAEYDIKGVKSLKVMQNTIGLANAQSAGSRAEVLNAQGSIRTFESIRVPTYRAQLTDAEEQCLKSAADLRGSLAAITNDIQVMKHVLRMACAENVSAVATSFFQRNMEAHESTSGTSMLKCTCCRSGKTAAWLRHHAVQPFLASIKSTVAKQLLQTHLLGAFDDHIHQAPHDVHPVVLLHDERVTCDYVDKAHTVNDSQPVMLVQEAVQHHTSLHEAQALAAARFATGPHVEQPSKCDERLLGHNGTEYRGCQTRTRSGLPCQKWTLQTPNRHNDTRRSHPMAGLGDHNYCRNPTGSKTIWCVTQDPHVPWEYCEPRPMWPTPPPVEAHECENSNKCTLSTPSCTRLRDRFMVIMGGLVDRKEALSDQLEALDGECDKSQKSYRTLLQDAESQLQDQQTKLAFATKSITESQEQSALTNRQASALKKEYQEMVDQCCDNKNQFASELCALTKIRGELYRLQGSDPQITDCEVTEWVIEECSASCGGGTQKMTRNLMVHPINGTRCPPTEMRRSCNTDSCPVDCKVDVWSEWSECTADCDGGVKTRIRSKTVEAENGGDPCPSTSESIQCNVDACNVDCMLSDWSDWGLCSKQCAGGHQTHTRQVAAAARGLGTCDALDSEQRLAFLDCNTHSCQTLLPTGRQLLRCTAMIDLVILVDGSGSMGQYGFTKTKQAVTKLVGAMEGGDTGVNMALLLYSGPHNWEDYEVCGDSSDPNVRPEPGACGIHWVSRFTSNITNVHQASQNMSWPAGSSLTALALAEAQAELINGRPNAASVVVVIGDAKPVSPLRTLHASREIKKVARLVWMPLGPVADSRMDDLKQWASMPWQDNVLNVNNYNLLDGPSTLNSMIAQFCPRVE